jgi:hypothetical protein
VHVAKPSWKQDGLGAAGEFPLEDGLVHVWPTALPLAYHFPWLVELASVGCASMQLVVTRQPLQAFHSLLIVAGSAAMYGMPVLVRSGRREPTTWDQGLWLLFLHVPYLYVAEDFKGQHEDFMRSEHSPHQFLVWFLLIFHALRLPIVTRTSSSLSSHCYSISSGTPSASAADFCPLFGIPVTGFVCGGF